LYTLSWKIFSETLNFITNTEDRSAERQFSAFFFGPLPDFSTLSRRETADVLSEIKHLEQGYKKEQSFFFLPRGIQPEAVNLTFYL